jgi:anti-sigma factor RsiW
LRSALRALLDRFAFHPRKALLTAFVDRELDASQSQKIEAHLEHCFSCADRAEEIKEGLKFFERSSVVTGNFPLDATFDRITTAIRERSPAQPLGHQQRQQAVYGRLKSELTIYLGDHAATQLLQRCNHSLLNRERLNEIVEPVIKTLLGERAGLAVIANLLRIWDRSQQLAG